MTPPLAQQLVVLRVSADVVIPQPGPPPAPVEMRGPHVRELQRIALGPFSSASLAPSRPAGRGGVGSAHWSAGCARPARWPAPTVPRGLAWGPLIASWARLS